MIVAPAQDAFFESIINTIVSRIVPTLKEHIVDNTRTIVADVIRSQNFQKPVQSINTEFLLTEAEFISSVKDLVRDKWPTLLDMKDRLSWFRFEPFLFSNSYFILKSFVLLYGRKIAILYKTNCAADSKGVQDQLLFDGENLQTEKQQFIDMASGFYTTRTGSGCTENVDRKNLLWFLRVIWDSLPRFHAIFGASRREYFCTDIAVDKVIQILAAQVHEFLFQGYSVFFITKNDNNNQVWDEVLVPNTHGNKLLCLIIMFKYLMFFVCV